MRDTAHPSFQSPARCGALDLILGKQNEMRARTLKNARFFSKRLKFRGPTILKGCCHRFHMYPDLDVLCPDRKNCSSAIRLMLGAEGT